MAEKDQEERALVGQRADLGRNGHDEFPVSSCQFKVQLAVIVSTLNWDLATGNYWVSHAVTAVRAQASSLRASS
jgi:hypothetical protein